MNDIITELSQRSLEPAPCDRARLTEEFLACLEDEPNAEFDAAWDAEILKRIDAVSGGNAALLPATEVFAGIRRNFR